MISILVALGLVLVMSTMAVTTTGAACNATVILDNDCAGREATYNITVTTPVTLQPGNDLLSVDFADGTDLSGVAAVDVCVDGNVVASVTKSGTHTEFPVPAAAGTILAGSTVEIIVEDVVNPAVAGDYVLDLDYKLVCCDAVLFDCGEYTIVPAISTYGFFWDSGPTYPGIAVNFVPPFMACSTHAFNLTFEPYLQGCNSPCASPVDIVVSLVASPQFPCADSNPVARVTLNLTGPASTWAGVLTWNKCEDDEPLEVIIYDDMPLAANTTYTWQGLIHFDTVGEYTICFKAVCPRGEADPCTPPIASTEEYVLSKRCFGSDSDQWSDTGPEEGYCSINWTGDVDTVAHIEDATTPDSVADTEDATTTNTIEDNHEITADSEAATLGGCFIATAAYGTPMAQEIQVLREFRDEYVLTSRTGGALVNLYYRLSPPVAEFITEHPSLKPVVRAGLFPAVAMSIIAVNTTPAEKVAIVGLLVLVSVAVASRAARRRSRHPKCT